jgi:hypothetical protein|tara:strand:- start:279 stop:458 length:180 start_codon:yes stop_codon:yes gene_type:complete
MTSSQSKKKNSEKYYDNKFKLYLDNIIKKFSFYNKYNIKSDINKCGCGKPISYCDVCFY